MSKTERTQINLNFRILETLGKGGMGEIYKAQDVRLNRIVAVKVLLASQFENEEAHQRFEREAQAGAQLDHDNIVTTHDSGIHDGRPYLVMAFIEGEALHQRLRREGPLSVEDTVRLIAPIARALAYAHRQNVIHRDITSNNIMIRASDERPMLIDFGIAQAAYDQRLTGPGEALGTLTYMSPEQANAQEIDGRSDLYSLGVVLYECLTGKLPFQSSNSMVLLSNIRLEPHPPLSGKRPDLPESITAVVDRCLAKDPADRFQDGDALADALEQSQLSAQTDATVTLAAMPPPIPQTSPAAPETAPLTEKSPPASTSAPPPLPVEAAGTQKTIPAPDRDPLPVAEADDATTQPPRRLWAMGLLLIAVLAVGGSGVVGYTQGFFDDILPFNLFSTTSEQTDSLRTTDTPHEATAAFGDTTASLPEADLTALPDDSLTTVYSAADETTAQDEQLATLTPNPEENPASQTIPPRNRRAGPSPGNDDGNRSEGNTGRVKEDDPPPPIKKEPTPADIAAKGVAAYRDGRYKEARELFEKTSQVKESQFFLGKMYANRQGGLSGEAQAETWYLKAAQQGHREAQYTLARHYFKKERKDKALYWYEAAGLQGHAEAQYQAGYLYTKAGNDEKARFWWKKGEAQGHEKAKAALTRLNNRTQGQ